MEMPTPTPTQAMPRHLVVLGHPSSGSFNRAVAETYCSAVRECGQIAVLRDLYALGFDPVLKEGERPGTSGIAFSPDIATELDMLRAVDALVLIYPIWFGGPPAIMKGYIDRVIGNGFRPDALREGRKHALLQDKSLLIFSSSGTTLPWLEEQGQWQALRQAFDRYITAIFGMRESRHVHFDAICEGMKERFIYEHLEEVRAAARAACAELEHERNADRATTAVARRPGHG